MSNPEEQFNEELELFNNEVTSCAQFFYAYIEFHDYISKNKTAYQVVNETALLWMTYLGALQTSFFIVLGRIFDNNPAHNINKLLNVANNHLHIFSKKSLEARKRAGNPNAEEWIDEYMASVYEPSHKDIRQLKKRVKELRNIYDSNYKDLRHKVFAHKEVDGKNVANLFKKANIGEMQELCTSLMSLHESLWNLFHNGREPVLISIPKSLDSLRENRDWAHGRVVVETNKLLNKLVANRK